MSSSVPLQPLEPFRSGSSEGEEILYDGNPSPMEVFCTCSLFMLLVWVMLAFTGIGLIGLIFPYWISRTTRYRITNQRISVIKGLLSREEQELDLLRVKDISLRKQNLRERMVGLGTIRVVSTDSSTPTLTLRMRQSEVWRDRLRDLVREVKKEAGVQYREEL